MAGAYHSRLMEPARAAFAAFLEKIPFAAPRFTVFTNTTGHAVAQPDDIRAALVKQVVSSVLWEDCMRSAAAASRDPGVPDGEEVSGTERSWVVTVRWYRFGRAYRKHCS